MDHNMVLSYDYAKRNRRRQRTNAPPLQTIMMAMVRRWSNKCGIARCSMSRATLEATGRRHRATTRSVSPWRPPGRQQTKQRCIMYPLWWPFRWPSRCGGTIPRASPDGGGPGLSYKPLNTAIGRALAPIGCCGHCNSAICFDVWGAMAILQGGGNFYIGVWHINLTGRTWRIEWNTYIGVLN
jgi:hypothetical protein